MEETNKINSDDPIELMHSVASKCVYNCLVIWQNEINEKGKTCIDISRIVRHYIHMTEENNIIPERTSSFERRATDFVAAKMIGEMFERLVETIMLQFGDKVVVTDKLVSENGSVCYLTLERKD